MGGYPNTNKIDYVEIDTLGNAIDFGDLITQRYSMGVVSNPTKIFGAGGNVGATQVSDIEVVTTASKGNAVDDGDLAFPSGQMDAASNSVRGIWAGGSDNNVGRHIQYRNLASSGNSIFFGDLNAVNRRDGAGASTQTRAIFGAGLIDSPSTTRVNSIEFVTIATTGNAQDFGDLTQVRNALGGLSDSHGGLGGF